MTAHSRPSDKSHDRSQSGYAAALRAGTRHRSLYRYALAATGAGALAFAGIAATSAAASASRPSLARPALLKSLNLSSYGAILTNAKGFSLYALSNSAGGKLVCSSSCLKFWPPVLVGTSTKSVSLGAGVAGEIGFVKRTATTKQVTFDGYPLYTFIKDTGPHQAKGEGVVAFGGTWELVRASALVAPGKASGTGATTSTTRY